MARLVVTALTLTLLAVPLLATPTTAAKPKCDGRVATIVGNNKANVIKGTPRRDVIVAKGGNDTILGRGGNDIICAGDGKDTVRGGAGKDRIFGGNKNDVLKGGAGKDTLNGGRGKDACYVNAGGGTKIKCEEADLRVTVVGPPTAFVDFDFDVTVLVKNIGAKTARGVELATDFGSVNTACEATDGNESLGDLAPRFFELRTFSNECDAPGAATLEASATTTSTELVLTNNAADSATTIEKP